MIPGWKIKRELTRLGQQLRAIPEAIWEPFFYGRYDRSFPSELTIHEGKVPLVDQVALLLIYPSPVLPESTVNLCRSLAQAGRSPLVISNAPLGADLLAQLAPHAWRLVERPNIGHDFGGYRDGIWLLWRWGVEPESLLILNDSVWLLLNDAAELIRRLNAAGGDVAGSILRQRGEERFLESYCYLVRAKALRSPAFRNFWAKLRLSSNKYKVIRRGERAHSATLIAGGLQLAPAFDNVAFCKGLDSVDDETLAQTLKYAAWPSPREAAAANDLLAQRVSPGWRKNALEFIKDRLKQGQFYSMFPVAAHGIIGYPFLKRSSDRVAILWRQAFLSAVKAGALKRPDPVVLAEIEARVAMDV